MGLPAMQSGGTFAEKTGFPADRLLVDPESALYEALRFNKGLKATFFSAEVRRNI
jgi:hypothetical protein